jgi:hypothetical protein
MDVDNNIVIVKKCLKKNTIQTVLEEGTENKELNGNNQEEERQQHVIRDSRNPAI